MVGGWFWAGGMHIFIWPLNDRTNRSGDIDHHHDLAIFDDNKVTFKIMLTYIDCFPNEMSKDQTTWISSVTILTIMRTFSDKFCDHTRSFNVVVMVLMMLRVTTKTVRQ